MQELIAVSSLFCSLSDKIRTTDPLSVLDRKRRPARLFTELHELVDINHEELLLPGLPEHDHHVCLALQEEAVKRLLPVSCVRDFIDEPRALRQQERRDLVVGYVSKREGRPLRYLELERRRSTRPAVLHPPAESRLKVCLGHRCGSGSPSALPRWCSRRARLSPPS